MRKLSKAISLFHKLENATLTALFAALLGLGITQIIARNFFGHGFAWIDPMMRASVLWIALFGALVATRQRTHIRIDIAGQWLYGHYRKIANLITDIFTAIVAITIMLASYRFMRFEYEDGIIAFAGIPTWIVAAVLPFAFGLISLRQLFYIGYNIATWNQPDAEEDE